MRIFLDHNATSPMLPEVMEVVARVQRDTPGNPSSIHQEGQRARAVVEDAREIIASVVGARPSEVVFTSGATEANNLALRGTVEPSATRPPHVVVSGVEHPSILRVVEELRREGAEVTMVAPDGAGLLRLESIAAAIGAGTRLVAIMRVNNETGVIQPVREAALVARDRGVPAFSDCVQALGRMPLSLEDLCVAGISISAHKIGGPKGVGALVWRGPKPRPLIAGGTQERGARAGTENVAGIAGFATACRIVTERREASMEHCRSMRDRFEEGVRELGGVIFGASVPRVATTSFFALPGIEGGRLLIAMDLAGIALSTGSACSSGLVEPSHVLLAAAVPADLARAAIRFSCGPENTMEEIEQTLARLRTAAAKLRSGSGDH